jgi:hypothetical protein
VREFRERLRSAEAVLVEELHEAHKIVMEEGARNSMIGMCQELGLFPPSSPPVGVADVECEYREMGAELPVIAQRLYNDQVRRLLGDAPQAATAGHSAGRAGEARRAMTAAFIVDFAHVVGVPLPGLPENVEGMLTGFHERIAEWRAKPDAHPWLQRRMDRAQKMTVDIMERGLAAVSAAAERRAKLAASATTASMRRRRASR